MARYNSSTALISPAPSDGKAPSGRWAASPGRPFKRGETPGSVINSFAYLRLPLIVAGVAFAIGAIGTWRKAFLRQTSVPAPSLRGELLGKSSAPILALTLMMVLFFHAARLALVVFDPYLSSRPLAEALLQSPPGQLIVDDQYYIFSSVFFYTDRRAVLLNGRVNNLEYGSYAPDAPKNVFITDRDLPALWSQPARYYLVAEDPQMPGLEKLVGSNALHVVARSGGNSICESIKSDPLDRVPAGPAPS